jgi:hypothetical protein
MDAAREVLTMDPWEVKPFVEDLLEKQGTYERYSDLCLRVETNPLPRDDFVDRYVNIIIRREEYFQQATSLLPDDKRKLLESLEQAGAPVEDLVTVDMLPPSMTLPLNKLSKGMICLYIMFPAGSSNPTIIPAYVEAGNDEAVFL